MDLGALADQHQAALGRAQQPAAAATINGWRAAWARIQTELSRRPDDPRGQQRWVQSLEVAVTSELDRLTRTLTARVALAQREAVATARLHAAETITTAVLEATPNLTVTLVDPPTVSLQRQVSPRLRQRALQALLQTLPHQAAAAATDRILEGSRRGWTDERIGREVQQVVGVSLVRALRIVRTETLRAYREATLELYRHNQDVVKGWRWWAHADDRTCAACWALHGTEYPLTEPVDDHPNGRCTPLPVVYSNAELGQPSHAETVTPGPTGPELFERLPAATQRRVLGPAKHTAWTAGEFRLLEVVGRTSDVRWGTMRYERSLTAIRTDRRPNYGPTL